MLKHDATSSLLILQLSRICRSTYSLTSTHVKTDDHSGHPSPTTTHPSLWNIPLSHEVIGTVPYTSHRRTAKSLSHGTYCVSLFYHHTHGCWLWRPPHVLRVRTISCCTLESSLTLILLTWRIGWAHNNARK